VLRLVARRRTTAISTPSRLARATDGAATAIDFDVTTKPHTPDPDKMHVWRRPTILTKAEAAGLLTVTPSVGDITAAAGAAMTHDLTQERTVLDRIGVGRLCTLRFRQNVAGQPVSLYGYMLPATTIGKR
jgi:hypothetical protein